VIRQKYGNKKVEYDGYKFDSMLEFKRYQYLKFCQTAGEISDLKLQVEYKLIPKLVKSDGKIERSVKYRADFVYFENGILVVEDTKGFKTKDYIIKRKLMLFVHGVTIKEVGNAIH
jgi:hypothetical protein